MGKLDDWAIIKTLVKWFVIIFGAWTLASMGLGAFLVWLF